MRLMEKGIDVTIIQRLLEDKDIKTTLIYRYTSGKNLLMMISPLADLKLKKESD